jgi:hypothetical protein
MSVCTKRTAVSQQTAETVRRGWQCNFAKDEIPENRVLGFQITYAKNYSVLKMEAVHSSESFATTYHTIRLHSSEDHDRGIHNNVSFILYSLFPILEAFPKVQRPSSLTL